MVYLMRILIVGDTDVGKTSLLVRFNDRKFTENNKTTIGVDYKARVIKIGEERVKLQIWDTAGQERFRSMTAAFYNKAHGVILSFDVNQPETFASLKNWCTDIRSYAPEGTLIYLSANKIDKCGGLDKADEWAVPRREIEKFCQEQDGMVYYSTSGKDGTNVNELFTGLATQLLTERIDLLQNLNEDDGSVGGPRTNAKKKIVMSDDSSSMDDMGFLRSKSVSGRPQGRCC
jgi:small GTP-binding protein